MVTAYTCTALNPIGDDVKEYKAIVHAWTVMGKVDCCLQHFSVLQATESLLALSLLPPPFPPSKEGPGTHRKLGKGLGM